MTPGFIFLAILACGFVDLEVTTATTYEERAPDFLIQSESKDPILTVPDKIVWVGSGSGSGSEDEREDEAKAEESEVEAKIKSDEPNVVLIADKHGVEANADKIQDVKSFKPQVEANDDSQEVEAKTDKPEIEAKTEPNHVEAETDKPQVEAKVAESDDTYTEANVNTNVNSRHDEAETDKPQVEAKTNKPGIEAKTDKPEIEAKTEPNAESKVNIHHVEAETNKPQIEAKVTQPDDPDTKKTDSSSSMPKFNSISEELKWKFNKARDSLKEAKQFVKLAYLTAAKNNRGTKKEQEVKKIITKTEVALVHAGEKMGLDYVHYK